MMIKKIFAVLPLVALVAMISLYFYGDSSFWGVYLSSFPLWAIFYVLIYILISVLYDVYRLHKLRKQMHKGLAEAEQVLAKINTSHKDFEALIAEIENESESDEAEVEQKINAFCQKHGIENPSVKNIMASNGGSVLENIKYDRSKR